MHNLLLSDVNKVYYSSSKIQKSLLINIHIYICIHLPISEVADKTRGKIQRGHCRYYIGVIIDISRLIKMSEYISHCL